jgi:hypothetical protein
MGRTTFITTVALAAALTVPVAADAAYYEDLRSPDARDAGTPSVQPPPSSIAQSSGNAYQDLRSPDARDAGTAGDQVAYQDLRSPDARDAGREPTSIPVAEPVIEIREVPQPGFDWGDAGIGAAGILAMVSIAGGLLLLLGGRRRRRGGVQPAH